MSDRYSFEKICCPANSESRAFADQMAKITIEPLCRLFPEDMKPRLKLHKSSNKEFDYLPEENRFVHSGDWWAYEFPKNSKTTIPNISVISTSDSLDISLNAEVKNAQEIVMCWIKEESIEFSECLNGRNDLWLKTYWKINHQPFVFHWIPCVFREPGDFDGDTLIKLHQEKESSFEEDRTKWINCVLERNAELSPKMKTFLELNNKKLNLAIRFTVPLDKNNPFWTYSNEVKAETIVQHVHGMKPLLDFFSR